MKLESTVSGSGETEVEASYVLSEKAKMLGGLSFLLRSESLFTTAEVWIVESIVAPKNIQSGCGYAQRTGQTQEEMDWRT